MGNRVFQVACVAVGAAVVGAMGAWEALKVLGDYPKRNKRRTGRKA